MHYPLKVEPLQQYTLPQYPAFDTPNPLHLPPQKASKAHFYKTALLGVVGLFSLSPNTAAQAQSENPIKFESLGFPHTYAIFGTGLPANLDRETAVQIIDSVFLANDIKLQKDYAFSKGEVHFNATAYNEKKGIGYVWVDRDNTTIDCYRSWGGRSYAAEEILPEDQATYEQLLKENEDIDKYTLKEEFFNGLQKKPYYKLLNIKRHHYGSKELHKKIDDYIAKHPNKSRDDYGQEILAQYDRDRVNLKEMKQIVATNDYHIGVLSTESSLLQYYYQDGESQKDAIKRLENLVQEYINWAKSEGRF